MNQQRCRGNPCFDLRIDARRRPCASETTRNTPPSPPSAAGEERRLGHGVVTFTYVDTEHLTAYFGGHAHCDYDRTRDDLMVDASHDGGSFQQYVWKRDMGERPLVHGLDLTVESELIRDTLDF